MPRYTIGEVSAPSGVLVIVDPGVLEAWQRDDIADPCAVIVQLPGPGPWPVVAVGATPDAWDRVEIVYREGEADAEAWHGNVTVDFARLILIDQAATLEWSQHSADGKADYVFWGADAAALAAATGAPDLGDGTFGWVDLPVDDVRAHGVAAEAKKEEGGLVLAGDFRPHNHHYQLLAQIRAAATGSGALSLAGAHVLGFMTTRGDGVFGVWTDLQGDTPLKLILDFDRPGSDDPTAEV